MRTRPPDDPPVAYQLPAADLAGAVRVGPRLWKKQVLPVGRVSYRGRTLDFSRRVLERIARNFRERVFDYTPVNAATADNLHNEDPFRFLGEVKDLSLESDGLYMTFEPNARGEELLRSNPKIGASVRYFANFVRPRDGREVGPVVRHVVLTQDPHVSGMRPGAYLTAGEAAAGVVDMTRGTYERGGSMAMTPTAAARAAANLRRATPAQRLAMIERRRAQVGEGQLRREMAQIAAANGAEYEAVLRSSGGERHRAGHSTGGLY